MLVKMPNERKDQCDEKLDIIKEAGDLVQLQCKLASDRLHLMDIKTVLSDTTTKLLHEREKNKSLVKIVDHLEGTIKKQKSQYNKRAANLEKFHEVDFENKLKVLLKEKIKTIQASHFQHLENLRQEHRHQMKINDQVKIEYDKKHHSDKSNGRKKISNV